MLAVEQVRAEGHAVAFGGRLLVPPSSAVTELVARFRPFGYTPFLQAGEQGLTWVRALPFVDVQVPSKPRTNIILFVLTVLSTLVAGSGAFFAFNPLAEPGRLLEGVPFAFTLLAILGTHEFGHYFTARAYGASVSLPYFIPGAAAASLWHAGRHHPHALTRARQELAVRHRRRGTAGGARGGAAGALDRSPLVEGADLSRRAGASRSATRC